MSHDMASALWLVEQLKDRQLTSPNPVWMDWPASLFGTHSKMLYLNKLLWYIC